MVGIILAFAVIAGLLWGTYCIGHINGWTECVKHENDRREQMRWISDYATGKATMADAPWRKDDE